MRRIALVLLIFAACKDQGPCRTEVVEATFGTPLYDLQLGLVESFEREGWDCYSESIRNAFGNAIGTKYTCTKC